MCITRPRLSSLLTPYLLLLQAFGINLYNLMIKYAFIKVGTGTNALARLSFYTTVCFEVGGYIYSFQDWENGILRGNRKAPNSFGPQFGSKDPRLAFMVDEPDARIHFGLNCGAKSCPPVRDFTVADLEEELRVVAISFCEDEENVSIDRGKKELHVSKIFSWYRCDWVNSTSKLPSALIKYLQGVKKQKLQRMLDECVPVKVVFKAYDWDIKARDILRFNVSTFNVNQRGVKALFTPRWRQQENVNRQGQSVAQVHHNSKIRRFSVG